jgi:putative chitinase
MGFWDTLKSAVTTTPPAAPISEQAPIIPVPSSPTSLITVDLLTALNAHEPESWAPILAKACLAHGIESPHEVAAFLANVMHETGDFVLLVENLNYKPESLLAAWPTHFTPDSSNRLGRTSSHPADQRGIAEAAYGGRMGNGPAGCGDGWAFRGRGLIQLTGRYNYTMFANKLGIGVTDLAARLETKDGAAESAAAFWEKTGCNGTAELNDITNCRKIVNGGSIGLADVTARYNKILQMLGG